MCSTFVQKIAEVEQSISRGQILNKSLIAMDHQMMRGNQSLKHYYPATVRCSLEKSISHLRNVNIGLIRSLYKIVQVLLLGSHHLVGCGFADSSGHGRAGHTVLGRRDTVRDGLARHFLLILISFFLPPPLTEQLIMYAYVCKIKSGECH